MKREYGFWMIYGLEILGLTAIIEGHIDSPIPGMLGRYVTVSFLVLMVFMFGYGTNEIVRLWTLPNKLTGDMTTLAEDTEWNDLLVKK